MIIALVFPFATVAAQAEFLTRSLLGPRWEGTALYVQWLCAPMLALAVTCWMDRLFDVFAKQKVSLVFEVVFAIVLLATVLLLFLVGSAGAVIPVFASASTVYYVALAVCAIRVTRIRLPAAHRLLIAAGGSAAVFGVTWLCSQMARSEVWQLGCFGVGYLVTIVAWLVFGGRTVVRAVFLSPVARRNPPGAR